MDAQTSQLLLSFAEETGPRYHGPDSNAVLRQLDA
jgi:hypothetical protein